MTIPPRPMPSYPAGTPLFEILRDCWGNKDSGIGQTIETCEA